MKTLVPSLLLCVAAAAPLRADWTYSNKTITDENGMVLKVSVSGTDLTVTGVTDLNGRTVVDLSKPVSDGYVIVSVGKSAFQQSTLTEVLCAASITNIAEKAFYNCAALTTAHISPNLVSVGPNAFYGCRALADVSPLNLPDLVSVAYAAFLYVPMAGELVLSNPALADIGDRAFSGAKITSADLSRTSLTNIGSQAFSGDTLLQSVALPETVKTIGGGAFNGCSALTEVSPLLPESVEYVGGNAFKSSPVQGTLVLSNPAITVIEENAFYSCDFTNVDLRATSAASFGKGAFYGNKHLTDVLLSANVDVRSFADDAFYQCSALTNLVPTAFPAVTNIGGRCFQNCRLEGDLVLSAKGLKMIPGQAFGKCQFSSVDLFGSGVTNIAASAFADNSGPAEYTMPVGLEFVGLKAFSNDPAMRRFRFSGNPPAWGGDRALDDKNKGAFYGCNKSLVACFYLPKHNDAWTAALQDPDAYEVVDLTANEIASFETAFPGEPVPRQKIRFVTQFHYANSYQYLCWWDPIAQPTVLLLL